MKGVLTFGMLILFGLGLLWASHFLMEATALGMSYSEYGVILKQRGESAIEIALAILIFVVIDRVRLRFLNIVDVFENSNGWALVPNEVKAAFVLGWFGLHSVVIYVLCM